MSYNNFSGVKFFLRHQKFQLTSLIFPNMLTMWFCGNVSKYIPPYIILKRTGARHLKGVKQKLSNIKYMVRHILREANISNHTEFVAGFWTLKRVINLCYSVNSMFSFSPCIMSKNKIIHDIICWKTNYNIYHK